MNNATIAIIGAGHMGKSLLGGLIANGYPIKQFYLADPDLTKLQQIKAQFDVQITTKNLDAIQTADIIIFAVKPDTISHLAKELSPIIQQNKPLIISIAAGVREATIQREVGGNIPIVRAMPNTPALIGCGATGLYANAFVSPAQQELAAAILRSVGVAVWIQDENLMDTITALSGSGPAYFYLIIEALQTAGEQLGLPKEIARLLTLQTAYGAAKLALESDQPAAELRKHAMTPGGSTEQGLRILEESDIRNIFLKTLQAAAHRAKELDKLTEK